MAEFSWPCVHRGDIVGNYDCGCGNGPQPVFACNKAEAGKPTCVIRLGNARYKASAKQYGVCGECSWRDEPPRMLAEKSPDLVESLEEAEAPPPPGVAMPLDHLRPWKESTANATKKALDIAVMPNSTIRLDDRQLGFKHAFNCSVVEWRGERIIAVRKDWNGSAVSICRIVDGHRLEPVKLLEIPQTRWNARGCEDPRLFVHQGVLYCSYIGARLEGKVVTAVQCLVKLDAEFGVVENRTLDVEGGRQFCEKNWSFFSYRDDILCVYQSAPHVIMKLDGDVIRPVVKHEWNHGYPAGMLRGGAPPVLHNGEYYHWFHGMMLNSSNARVYSIGLYTFEAGGSFRPKRVIRNPLLLPNDRERPAPGHAAAVFPCGAVFDHNRGQWCVSYGYFDHWCYLGYWSGFEIESALTPIE